ncbi:MAG: MFS transporter [Chloroflexi bacterium]|nr:MFS transporter [Chloroflexota bacterium]
MHRSLNAVLLGTFSLRFSTGLTGGLLTYYLADLHLHGGPVVDPIVVGLFTAAFFAAELVLSPLFGPLADRWGYHRVMQLGPLFGLVAVVLTGITTDLTLLGVTRVLEGASTAASVPSILGYIAIATAYDEHLRGRAVARFEAATLAGIGIGLVAAGPMWTAIGPIAFFVNAAIYGGFAPGLSLRRLRPTLRAVGCQRRRAPPVRHAALPEVADHLARLASGTDLDRDQCRHRPLDHAVDLPAGAGA